MTNRVITSVLAASLFAATAMFTACGEEEKPKTPDTKPTTVVTPATVAAPAMTTPAMTVPATTKP